MQISAFKKVFVTCDDNFQNTICRKSFYQFDTRLNRLINEGRSANWLLKYCFCGFQGTLLFFNSRALIDF